MQKETTRQKKVSKLLQKELSDIFLRHRQELFGNEMVTITVVRVTPDLSLAKVYLSFLQTEGSRQLVEKLNQNQKSLKHALITKLRNELRTAPQLLFYMDDTQEVAKKMDSLLNSLVIPPPDQNFNPNEYTALDESDD